MSKDNGKLIRTIKSGETVIIQGIRYQARTAKSGGGVRVVFVKPQGSKSIDTHGHVYNAGKKCQLGTNSK